MPDAHDPTGPLEPDPPQEEQTPAGDDPEEVEAPFVFKLILTAIPFFLLFSLLFLDRCTRG